MERHAGEVAAVGWGGALVMKWVEGDDLEMQVGWPAAVDRGAAEPADDVAGPDPPAGCEVVEGGAVEVAVQGVEAGAVRCGVAQDDGGAVVEGLVVVGDGDDGAGERRAHRGARGGEEVEAEVEGSGLMAPAAARTEYGCVVEEPGFAVPSDRDGRSGTRGLPLDPGPGRGGVGEGVQVGKVQAAHGQIEDMGARQHRRRHHRSAGPGLADPGGDRRPGPGWGPGRMPPGSAPPRSASRRARAGQADPTRASG